MSRSLLFSLSFLGLALLLISSFGCAPSSPQGGGPDSAGSDSQAVPELTQEIIDQRINDARVFDVLPDSGTGEPISWGFDEDEPKEITVVERRVEGSSATLVLDIKTQSASRSSTRRYLAGQIRTDWELRTGWVLRRWEIVNTENISMKYKDFPKSAPQNSNR
jgi:hypothetical protein